MLPMRSAPATSVAETSAFEWHILQLIGAPGWRCQQVELPLDLQLKRNQCGCNARARTGGDGVLCEASEEVGSEAGVAEAREERHARATAENCDFTLFSRFCTKSTPRSFLCLVLTGRRLAS